MATEEPSVDPSVGPGDETIPLSEVEALGVDPQGETLELRPADPAETAAGDWRDRLRLSLIHI